ncbi:acyl-CoA dehydrogenase family protein [Paraburkholderia saeva]|uniref:Acyl-CoA dehydrogenase AidB n=1 Tax=Paraburkholderia saeva TaxID=2777537 RepID=A0A9N8RXW6_9BURK|nr:acyl-CoA dehydrogenase family protein [Paraburkholderia saeva]CAG4901086.1 Putative acyl-CoA dehydrogenase AidB [Paraburkholderia saeva]CAG4925509.1 Putative acyl-CoA dehydrogenase AidB [Paraburkholderia saeva]
MEWKTHDVTNVVPELRDYNLYTSDIALQEAVRRAGGGAHEPELSRYGEQLGLATTLHTAELANRCKPELQTFDRQGQRIDRVEFHPAWHTMMKMLREQNLVAQPFSDSRAGAWAAYAAGFSMHGQIEAGSQCPTSMTFASIPVLRKDAEVFRELSAKLYSTTYDARDVPIAQKASILVGMGMTEKQGGSDVRANTTLATPLAGSAGGREYSLVGHKWFFSAPMCDAHLVLARTASGMSCFFVPRFRPDGSKNAVHIQRLKDKVGNRSNASSEVEFLGAWGRMIGEEGRGVPTIIEMATHTRLNCVMGSTGMMRQALVQAVHHARGRSVFGRTLVQQPLMQNVLADLALESEAATHLMMRLAESFSHAGDDPLQRAYRRIVTPAAKYWVAKRAIEHAAEAMEVIGGNGYMDDSPTGRLFREAPVISIWEGSGNVMALDMMRAIQREPDAVAALVEDLRSFCHADALLRRHLDAFVNALKLDDASFERQSRREAQRLILLVQARLAGDHAPQAVSDAFITSRFDAEWGRTFGLLPRDTPCASIIERAWPI